MTNQIDHRTAWTIERLLFKGEEAGFLVKEEGSTRAYTVKENALPAILIKALKGKVKLKYLGGWDQALKCIEGPVEIIS